MSRDFSSGVACDQGKQLIRAEEIFYNEKASSQIYSDCGICEKQIAGYIFIYYLNLQKFVNIVFVFCGLNAVNIS